MKSIEKREKSRIKKSILKCKLILNPKKKYEIYFQFYAWLQQRLEPMSPIVIQIFVLQDSHTLHAAKILYVSKLWIQLRSTEKNITKLIQVIFKQFFSLKMDVNIGLECSLSRWCWICWIHNRIKANNIGCTQ